MEAWGALRGALRAACAARLDTGSLARRNEGKRKYETSILLKYTYTCKGIQH